jgi:hypothetical protein
MDDVNVIRAEADIHYGSARPGGLVGMAFAFAPAAALAGGARAGETNAEQPRDNPDHTASLLANDLEGHPEKARAQRVEYSYL